MTRFTIQQGTVNPPLKNEVARHTEPVTAANITSWASGPLPLAYEPKRPLVLAPTDEVIVEGTVSTGSATVVLRIDDRQQPAYNERQNEERTLGAGPFRIALQADQLAATNGQKLNFESLHRIIFFATDGEAQVSVATFGVNRAKPAPADMNIHSLGTGPACLSVLVRFNRRHHRMRGIHGYHG